ncbi:protease modulator HflC [Nitrincola nitratireducens]|uniref:Protein HflC n=1 Tax=Nitrincola nitratireducens TaxID=1229521 RepID=W9VNU4_9GAMM|nr:protease modulator HflC [Nitrincola nitratireducens]EXJ12155.1 Modulator of FtsH protease HflC [Nitrincola nitratireducens]
MKPNSVFVLVLALVVVWLASESVYIVKETERAVKLRFGEIVEPDIAPGLHFKIPFVNTVRKFEARLITLDSRPQAFLTLEAKRLIVDSFIKWRVKDVERYYTATSGDENRANSLLASRIETNLRNQFGERTLNQVVSGEREELMEQVNRQLSVVAERELGIEIVDIRIKRIDLPTEVSTSVYDRMRSERLRLARELRARGLELAEGIRADADRQRTVITANAFSTSEILRGEGDAEAAGIYSSAFSQDPEFYSFIRSIGAYRESFSGQGDVLVLEPTSEFFRYMRSSGVQ